MLYFKFFQSGQLKTWNFTFIFIPMPGPFFDETSCVLAITSLVSFHLSKNEHRIYLSYVLSLQ